MSSSQPYQDDLTKFDHKHHQKEDDEIIERTPTGKADDRTDAEQEYYKLERVPSRESSHSKSELDDDNADDDKTKPVRSQSNKSPEMKRRRSSITEIIDHVFHHHKDKDNGKQVPAK